MPNVKIDATKAYRAFSHHTLMPIPVQSLAEMPEKALEGIAAKNVSIFPAATTKSSRRMVSWKFYHAVISNKESSPDDFVDAVDEALGLIPAGARTAAEGFGSTGGFKNGMSVLRLLISVFGKFKEFLDEDEKNDIIKTDNFPVAFEFDKSEKGDKYVGYELYLHSRWVSTDKDDPDDAGFNQCQGFFVNNKKTPGVTAKSNYKKTTDLYTNKLFSKTYKLGKDQNTHLNKFEILSSTKTDWNLFMNLNTSATLWVYAASTEKELTEMMADMDKKVAYLDTDTLLNPSEYLAGSDEDEALKEAEEIMLAEAMATEEDPGDFIETALALAPTLVPGNEPSKRLMEKVSRGKIPHLGMFLAEQDPEMLFAAAEGLDISPDDLEDLSAKSVASAIARKLTEG